MRYRRKLILHQHRSAASPTPGPTILILDEFSDSDGKSLPSHSISPINLPSAAWSCHLYNNWLVISNNQAVPGTYSQRGVILDASVADCQISVDGNTASQDPSKTSRKHKIVARLEDKDNLWFIQISLGDNKLMIVERNAGTNTTRAGTAIAYANDTDFNLTVALNGETIHADLSGPMGPKSAEYTSASFNKTKTKHGLEQEGQLTSWVAPTFDNFKVTSL